MMRLPILAFVLLLAAYANPVSADRGVRDAVRMSQLQNPEQAQPERRGFHEYAAPEAGTYMQSDSGQAGTDAARRSGKLSPEERRALRRQIDEVGSDIYQPQR